jgi:MFS family permease
VSPIAGALLDRHGRTRLVVLDYLIAMGSFGLIGVLALTHLLSAPLLVLIVGISSLTGPLSATGLRSLFPVIVPSHLWERVNAVDSNGFVLAAVM